LYGVVCVILRLAVLIQYQRVTDGRTDGQTHDDSIYRASIQSRGKKRLNYGLTGKSFVPSFRYLSTNGVILDVGVERSLYCRRGWGQIATPAGVEVETPK